MPRVGIPTALSVPYEGLAYDAVTGLLSRSVVPIVRRSSGGIVTIPYSTSGVSPAASWTPGGLVQVGDVMILVFNTLNTAMSLPSGWTSMHTQAGYGYYGGEGRVYGKVLTSGDLGSQSFTLATGADAAWSVHYIRGLTGLPASGDKAVSGPSTVASPVTIAAVTASLTTPVFYAETGMMVDGSKTIDFPSQATAPQKQKTSPGGYSHARAALFLQNAPATTTSFTTGDGNNYGSIRLTFTLTPSVTTTSKAPVDKLADLSDLTFSSLADGDMVYYESATGLWKNLYLFGINSSQTGTSYTATLADAFQRVTRNNASASTHTVPPNTSAGFRVGTELRILNLGAGAVTVTPGSGVTINAPARLGLVVPQYNEAVLVKTGTDTWNRVIGPGQMVNNGAWTAGTYPVGSVVTYQGRTYVAQSHTSATPSLPTADYVQAFATLPANDSNPFSYSGTSFRIDATSLYTGSTGLGGLTTCLVLQGPGGGFSDRYVEMTKTFNVAGTITFADAASSEGASDYGKFYIDGVLQHQTSGTPGWTARSYAVAAGSHTFRWLYTKDFSATAGLDNYAIANLVTTGTGTGATAPWFPIGNGYLDDLTDVELSSPANRDAMVYDSSSSTWKNVKGGLVPTNLLTKTASYTAVAGDWILANATSGAFTITLPSNPAVGAMVNVQKIDSSVNVVTLDPTGAGTVHGQADVTLESQWTGATLQHQGSDVWMVVATSSGGAANPILPSIDNLSDFNAVFGASYTAHDSEFDAVNSTSLPSGWSWQNQGAASYRERFGAGTMVLVASQWRSIVKSVTGLPSTYDAIAKISCSGQRVSGGLEFGLLLTDGTAHRIYEHGISNSIDVARIAIWSSASAFSSVSDSNDVNYAAAPLYFWIHKNSSTSYDFKISVDGRSWLPVAVASNPGITVTHIGIAGLGGTGYEISAEWFRIR